MFSILHERAMRVAGEYRRAEAELMEILLQIDDCAGFRELGYPSLFAYVNRGLGLSEACTQQLIFVSRKSRTVPELRIAIAQGDTTVSKAKTIVAVITPANKTEWLEKAKLLSKRELELAVAKERPGERLRDHTKVQGGGFTRVNVSVEQRGLSALERAREILAQKRKKPVSLAETVEEVSAEYVRRHDPVAKADRSIARIIPGEHRSARAVQAVHAVHHRDRGACQFRLPDGKACGAKNWIHLHDLQPRSEGGKDTQENLLTLCSTHHRMIHAH